MRAMCAFAELRRATWALRRLHDRGTAPSGVRATQLPILVVLGSADGGDVSVSTLAKALALDGSALSRSLKVLEDRGLIHIDAPEEDACVPMVSLTLEGSRVLTGALARWQALHRTT
jgi:DNA-binding MarR family transcriptional regulator